MKNFGALTIIVLVLFAAGCKIRRISDGKPPWNGVATRTVENSIAGKMTVEEHYRNGEIFYVRGVFRSGTMAYERFLQDSVRRFDSSVSYYRSGAVNSILVTGNDRLMFQTTFYEDGTMKGHSDSLKSEDFYENGALKRQTLFKQGQVASITSWYQNGQRKNREEWWNDKRNGEWSEWDSAGKKVRNEQYVDGRKVR